MVIEGLTDDTSRSRAFTAEDAELAEEDAIRFCVLRELGGRELFDADWCR